MQKNPQSPSVKIIKAKHWIKTYEARIERYQQNKDNPLLKYKIAAMQHKIKLWKRSIMYFEAARKLDAKSAGAAKVKRAILLKKVYKSACEYFDTKNIMGKENQIARIFISKYLLENSLGGMFAQKTLSVSKDVFYKSRQKYNPKLHGDAYRLFAKEINKQYYIDLKVE